MEIGNDGREEIELNAQSKTFSVEGSGGRKVKLSIWQYKACNPAGSEGNEDRLFWLQPRVYKLDGNIGIVVKLLVEQSKLNKLGRGGMIDIELSPQFKVLSGVGNVGKLLS